MTTNVGKLRHDPEAAGVAFNTLNQTYLVKGHQLAEYLAQPGAAGAKEKSAFEDHSLLSRWGWVDDTHPYQITKDCRGLDDLLDVVGYTEGTAVSWQLTTAYSDQEPTNGALTEPTYATYFNTFWPALGVIVSDFNEGPDYILSKRNSALPSTQSSGKAPQLKHWSDIVFLTWQHLANKSGHNVSSLKFVFRRSITGEDTLRVLARILRQRYPNEPAKWSAPMWPAIEIINVGQAGFEAMLYTPNVRGLVWMLIQHRDVFKNETIRSITAYVERGSVGLGTALKIEIGDPPDDGLYL